DHRDPEGQGLSRPGGGLDEDVASSQHVRDDELLDGEWVCDASPGEGIHDLARGAEVGERLRHDGCAPYVSVWGDPGPPKTLWSATRNENLSAVTATVRLFNGSSRPCGKGQSGPRLRAPWLG